MKVQLGKFVPIPIAPIALLGSIVNGRPNFMALGFVSGANVSPPIISISINKKHYSIDGIVGNRAFSVNFPSANYVNETDYCGLVSGRERDKSGLFTPFYGDLKTAPMIQEFPLSCECELLDGGMEFEMDRVFFGRVTMVYANNEILCEPKGIDVPGSGIFYFSGLESAYRSQGEYLGKAWGSGMGLARPEKQN